MDTQDTTPPRISLSAGIQLLLFIIVAVAVWVWISAALHLRTGFAGYLILWYWAAIEKADYKKLSSVVLGALAGVVLAWQMKFLPVHFGMGGLVLGLLIIVAAVFAQIMGRGAVLVNNSTMLFLTVLTAPQLAGVATQDLYVAIVLGTVYFGAAVYVAKSYASWRIKAKPRPA